MNLFCFTLEGSTDSIYEPAYSQTLKEVSKYQCSPALLRRKAEWRGSDPSINSNRPQSATKLKRDNRRSCVPTSALDNEILERDINHTCWMSSGDKKDLFYQKKVQSRETCKAPSQSSKQTRDDKVKELSSDRTQSDPPAEASETTADTAEPVQATGRLKKLQNLVQAKKTHQTGSRKEKSAYHLAEVVSNNKPALTCIALRRRTEKKSSKTAASPQQLLHQQARVPHEDPQEEGAWSPQHGIDMWSPFECPQPWSPFDHTCHRPRHELWACSGTMSLPRNAEWDRFESLIQELDSKQSNLSPPQMIRSITDLHLSQNPLARCGRLDALRQQSSLIKPQDNRSCPQKQEQKIELPVVWLQRREVETSLQSDKKHVKASPETTLTALIKRDIRKDEAEKRQTDQGRPLTMGHRRSSNSLESLYSHNSGQSSSSGVTSGSDCSSNRDSLRLDDDLLYTRQLCGRARVHTDYVPSPYDTESLKLKVGDVIDIIAKPSMGIWTGMLNGRTGNFKFIYVDVLTEESSKTHQETHIHEVSHKSTVHEVLKRLSLEEYSSSLQLNGYQTVDDLMRLREHHLMELNVTNPEHRQRLLAAVDSLQQLGSVSQLENEACREAKTSSESRKADMNNCPRDSGCDMPPDSPDSSTAKADFHLKESF
ncbi:SAM domain-containing protein SAMSN-1b isoform X2 [Amphiprion ocellaris]|uniref:SAM domain-containing protein SAMSN-1b isoform X2 n=1 Tax=Amphiprion ocellaris TaxID=80972 RepID=UPI00241145B8|nr:SAM domain-containing protein SAMSN-1b isoform X2 [Amphiprion ocellaris]